MKKNLEIEKDYSLQRIEISLKILQNCILCAACTTSCPVFWTAETYVGPAAIVNAHRFVFDSRDEGTKQRLEILKDVNGAFRCRTAFNCTSACPRGIQVTKAIEDIKRETLLNS